MALWDINNNMKYTELSDSVHGNPDEVPHSVVSGSTDQYDPLNFHDKFTKQAKRKEDALQNEVNKDLARSGVNGGTPARKGDETASDVFESFMKDDNNKASAVAQALETG